MGEEEKGIGNSPWEEVAGESESHWFRVWRLFWTSSRGGDKNFNGLNGPRMCLGLGHNPRFWAYSRPNKVGSPVGFG